MTEPTTQPETSGRRSVAAAPASDTRTKLLDAAEVRFALEGVDRASLRSITQAAGANLAAVHYHFGSKEALVREVLARRLNPLNQRRLELLDEVEAKPGIPAVHDVVRAFVRPALEMVQQERGGHDFARFVCRTFSDAGDEFRGIVLDQFREVVERFTAAFERALPGLPRDELFWRFHFMVGSMVHTAGLGFLAERLSNGLCDPDDLEGVTAKLVGFLAGGLSAGATPANHNPGTSS